MKLPTMKWSAMTLGLFLVMVAGSIAAQDYRGSVTVFSEDGENFTLFLNGDQKNANPASRVVAENIAEVPVSFRIVFDAGSIPVLKKSGLRGGKDCLYAIQKNKKGEHVLKIKNCTDPFSAPGGAVAQEASPAVVSAADPGQLSAMYDNGLISINDGRTLTVTKVKVTGMTYPRVLMNAPKGARATITYDDNGERYAAEVPFQYEVKDFSNNNSFLTLTVDEGGPERTWHVKLQNSNGYDLKIE